MPMRRSRGHRAVPGFACRRVEPDHPGREVGIAIQRGRGLSRRRDPTQNLRQPLGLWPGQPGADRVAVLKDRKGAIVSDTNFD